MKFQQAINNAKSISDVLDIFQRIKEYKNNGTINNRQYSEMFKITWDRYRGILDNEIRKTT